MTAQVSAQPISVFSAAIAQINGSSVNGEVLPDTGNLDGKASFRMLIDSMLAQHSGESPNPAADNTLQEVLAEDNQDDIAAELAAIMPFLAAFGLTAADVKPPAADNISGMETTETGSQLFGALTPRNVSQGNSAATAITAGANAFAADDPAHADHPQTNNPIQILLARQNGESRREGVGTVEPAFRQSEQPGPSFASIQQAMQSAASPAQSNAPTASHSLPTPVGAGHWGEDFANRVVWMATRLESRADLVLTPPQMGRIEVSLSITGDQATANFVSGNPAVREALEAALPRLREVLADAGIQLGQTQVGAGNPQQTAQHEKNGENSAFGRPSLADESRNMSGEDARSGSLSSFSGGGAGRGLVDVFA